VTSVLVQAGHSAAYPPYAVQGGGAPGEAAWTTDLAARIAAVLEARGITCVLVGHWHGRPPPLEVRQEYGLFLSLHYDSTERGRTRNSWCFADRAANDPAGAESDRAVALWQALYPAATGIPLREERRNVNTSYYYAFAATTPDTPGILLEHGCGSPVPVGDYPAGDDAAFLREQIDLVAQVDTDVILAFLERADDIPAPPTLPPPNPSAVLQAALAECNAIKAELEQELRRLEGRRRIKRGTTDRLIAAGRGEPT